MLVVLQTGADEVHADDVQRRDEPDDDQACLRNNGVIVSARVHVTDQVMEPATTDLRNGSAENGSHVDGCKLVVVEVVKWHNEDRDRDVGANDPCEGEEVVGACDEDRQFGDCDDGPLSSPDESVRDQVSAALLDTYKTHPAALLGGDLAVAGIECLIEEEHSQDECDSIDHGNQPERPTPACGLHDEGRYEWSYER